MIIRYLIVHCSATRCNVPFSLEQLRLSHRANGWKEIGYHFYITRDGRVHQIRPLNSAGIHARGYNHCSVGICYEGGLDEKGNPTDTRTRFQKDAHWDVLFILKQCFPQAQVIGHSQLPDVKKACPCFDAKKEYQSNFSIQPPHE